MTNIISSTFARTELSTIMQFPTQRIKVVLKKSENFKFFECNNFVELIVHTFFASCIQFQNTEGKHQIKHKI